MPRVFNDSVSTTLIDSDQIQCGGKPGYTMKEYPPFTGIGESCFLRVNSIEGNQDSKIRYRNVSVKSI
jgi:hypothetical protein